MGGTPSKPIEDIPRQRKEPRPDFSQPPPQEKLPKDLQKIVDDEDSLLDDLYDGRSAQNSNLLRQHH